MTGGKKANHPLKVQAGLDEILPAPTDARRARFGAISYYDWTGSTSKMPAPAQSMRCRCGHGDTFLIAPL